MGRARTKRVVGGLTEKEWDALPVKTIPLGRVVYMIDGLDPSHIFPTSDANLTAGPIRVALLNTGQYLVRDGRHRVIRALLRHETQIEARIHEK